MGDSLDAELTALRVRAYGADADIHDDPQALARLRTLEEEHRARQQMIEVPPPVSPSHPQILTSIPAAGIPSFAAPADSSSSSSGGVSTAAMSTASEATTVALATAEATMRVGDLEPEAAARSRSTGRRLVMACALTAVMVAALTVPVTVWATSQGDKPYAVLHAIDAPANTVFFSPESEAQRYEDFLGMRISTGSGYQQDRCIVIELQPESDTEFASGATRGACSARGFEAVADVSVLDDSLSQEVRDELGDITALRFAVVGDEIHVFAATAPAEPAESS